jgi:NADH:ubiquinone oxidoreductase subunit 6 (subunit J)
MNALFFWLFSGGMIVCALAVILNRNAVASALCFTFAIVFMAGLFVMLSAFFLAAVQILVTAGAVMVLFLFIIMLLDLAAMEHAPRQKVWMGCTLVLALGFLLIVARVLAATPQGFVTMASLPVPKQETLHVSISSGMAPPQDLIVSPTPAPTQAVVDKGDDTHRIGRLLFRTDTSNGQTSYVAPFEITSLLILVATIGVIVLCKQEDRPRPGPREEITREAPPVDPQKEPALKI